MATETNYRNFSADEFIKDEFFQRWVYYQDTESSLFWDTFLKKNPEKAEDIEDARRFLRLLNFNEGDVFESKINALKKRVDFAIDNPLSSPAADRSPKGRLITTPFLRWWKVAAALALLALVVYLVRINFPLPTVSEHAARVTEHRTNNGERTLISLEDGTKVWLNVASTIRYPETFQESATREVYLEGEAFFDVTPNKSKPFIVRTEAVQIKVLGTTFNVKSYAKENEIQTTLVEGKVTVESMDEQPKTVTLAPNQVATYHKTSRKIVLNNQMDTEALAGWKDGRLIFDDKPLSEIVLALERWYNVKIMVEDEKSLKCHFSAKIENLTLNEVLELFKASDGIEYTINNREVTIRGAICEN